MSKTIKFTTEELNDIKNLQEKYQKKMIFFGQLMLERIGIEENIKRLNDAETKAKTEYLELQNQEEKLLNTISEKYGDGKLNINDGTFTPTDIK